MGRRANLQHDKNRIINRIAGLLECANVKMGSVASDIVGIRGGMLYAMAKGETNAARLSEPAVGSLQNKKAELKLALESQFGRISGSCWENCWRI